jgi:hypothetical protein
MLSQDVKIVINQQELMYIFPVATDNSYQATRIYFLSLSQFAEQ